MGRKQGPRKGSLQFWPRKRAEKFIPGVNWSPIIKNAKKPGKLLGFIGYKVGMVSAYVKDNTLYSMTKNKKIFLPATILECPPMKILSVRFYKNGNVFRDVLNNNIDKEMVKKVKLPEAKGTAKEEVEKARGLDFDDVRVVVYSQAKKTGFKKTPDITELAIAGSKEEKLNFILENLPKEISVANVFGQELVDVRGVTTGKGLQGPVKRFGVHLRSHKAEKGVRRVGSIGPWHPARLSFQISFAGQMGLFTRIVYNNKIIAIKKISDGNINPEQGFRGYGKIQSDYMILSGSAQGSKKRQLLITPALRPTKKQLKKQYELIELR